MEFSFKRLHVKHKHFHRGRAFSFWGGLFPFCFLTVSKQLKICESSSCKSWTVSAVNKADDRPEVRNNWTLVKTNAQNVKTTQAVEFREEHRILCCVSCGRVIEVNHVTESTWAGPRPETAGPFNTTIGFEHLFTRGNQSSHRRIRERCICCRCSTAAGDLSPIDICSRRTWLFVLETVCGSVPPHCVIEKPVARHHTSAVRLRGRASASTSGPALSSLRQSLADCSESENPWLAENNKYPWEAARWTFTVSLAGEGEICQTSHQASVGEQSRFTYTL